MAYVVPPTLKKNSYSTTLTAGISVVATSIPVADVTPFYDAAGALITKGIVLGFNLGGATPEEITITGCSVAAGVGGAGTLTGAVRAVNTDVNTGGTALGPAFAWTSGTKIGVMMSIGIYNILINDIIAHQAAIALNAPLASPTFTGVITIPDAASSLRRVSGAANGELLIGNGTGYTPATLTQGTNITITNAAGQITIAAAAGGASFWTALTATTDFATTVPGTSTSTITMITDQTAYIKPGYAIRFTLSSVVYYAVCTSITPILLTIAGAPLTNSANALTALAWGTEAKVMEITQTIPGYFEEATINTAPFAIETYLFSRYGIYWRYPAAYCVNFSVINGTPDTGTTPIINTMLGTPGSMVALSTSNSSTGISCPGNNTSQATTVVDINTSNYAITRGQYIEISIVKGTDTVKAMNLTWTGVFVFQ
jgi:hypothetical protein